MTRPIIDEVLEVVREMPGLTQAEITELMPHVNKGSVSSTLVSCTARGLLMRRPRVNPKKYGPRTIHTYMINPNPTPVAKPPKLKAPTQVAVDATVAELKQQVAELEAWKAEAIARFPDLAVEPVVLRARKIVAEIFKDDNGKAGEVMAGRLDHAPIMRATVMALEEVV